MMVEAINPLLMVPATLNSPSNPLRPGTKPPMSKAVANLKELQELMMDDCRRAETTPIVRAQVARALCLVLDCIRELRGIPKAGQLRPELDPVRMAKQLRKARGKSSIEVAGLITRIAPKDDDAFAEMPPDQPTPKTSKAGPETTDATGEADEAGA